MKRPTGGTGADGTEDPPTPRATSKHHVIHSSFVLSDLYTSIPQHIMATQVGSLKRLKGFPGFNVDGFNYQSPDIVAYFLTHFHADHTCGLHAGFKGPAPIYCSPVTAALLTSVTGVKPGLVRAVEVGDTVEVKTADGVVARVTLIDANHCPGSVLFHFLDTRGCSGSSRTVLHTGDFRAARCVREDPVLRRLIADHGPVGELLLDTTYCAPQWTFPDQAAVCDAMAEVVRRELRREPRTLFLVGSYQIGKERAVAAVARAAGSRAGVGWHRARTLKLSGWWSDDLFLCEDDEHAVQSAMDAPRAKNAARLPPCRVRVVSMGGGPQHEAMARILRDDVDPVSGQPWWRAIVAFRPTGWSYARSSMKHPEKAAIGDDLASGVVPPPDGGSSSGGGAGAMIMAAGYKPWVENDGATRCYSVPYSEHSSFDELVAFVRRIRPVKVTPTVNADTRAQREKILKHFLEFTDMAADKGRLDHYFNKRTPRQEEEEEEEKRLFGSSLSDEGGDKKGKEVVVIDDDDDDDNNDDALGGGDVDPDVLAALGLSAAEVRRQAALWEEAKKSHRAKRAAAEDAILGPFPLGCVALVKGGGGGFGGRGPRYVQFRDKAHVEQRLRDLGATVVQRAGPRVTHVVVPSGGEALAEEQRRYGVGPAAGRDKDGEWSGERDGEVGREGSHGAADDDGVGKASIKGGGGEARGIFQKAPNPPPAVVTEGWVMRHVRASKTGTAAVHTPASVRAHESKVASTRKREAAERKAAEKRRREEAAAGVEQRPGRERTMSRAVMDRVARALAQRLFLVQRRDISRGGGTGCRDEKWHAVFAVFGTTGNVYECHVSATPSCTCPDFTGEGRGGGRSRGAHVCKHLMWVYLRVLGVSRDDPVLCQVALLQSELAAMLAAPTAAQRASLAAAAVREAYVAASGGVRGTEDAAPALATRQPTSGAGGDDDALCPVCFDPIEDPAEKAAAAFSVARGDSAVAADGKVWWCKVGCGGNVHAACMRRWIGKSGQAAACPLCRAHWIPQDGSDAAAAPAPDASHAPGGAAEACTSPGGTSYVNLRRYQPGTASGRDYGQYNEFAQRAIERRENERRKSMGQ